MLKPWTRENNRFYINAHTYSYSPIFALSAGFQFTKKSILEIQVTKTTLTSRSGWFWLPVFLILIIYKLDLNLNSLLVTRQMTLFHQGVRMGGKLVP